MSKIYQLLQSVQSKTQKLWKSSKGRTIMLSGGSALVGIIIIGIVFANASAESVVANRKFAMSNSAGNSTSSAADSSAAHTIISSDSSTSGSIPIVGAAPTPSGAAPTAAEALHTIPVTSVDLNHTNLTLKIGATAQLTAKITPSDATDKTMTWTSTNSGVATVDSNGIVTGKSAGTALVRSTNSDGQRDTCTVTVSSSSGGSGNTNAAAVTGGSENENGEDAPTASAAGHVANYQGISEVKTYTDEITGITQTVHFQGVGAGYREVAGGYADINTTAQMGAAHTGGFKAVYSLTGSNGYNRTLTGQGLAKNGQNGTFTFDNLTAGTYTLQLTAYDGTVVTRYHFSVDSSGNVQ